MGKLIFTVLCALTVIVECAIIALILRTRPKKIPISLFVLLLGAASVALISYCVSIYSRSYFFVSLFSSIYFCSIDYMLLGMLDLIIEVTDFTMHPFQVITRWMARIYGVFDCIVLMINPFAEIAVHYTPDPNAAGHWIYDPRILYQLHLALCYIVVIMIAYCLLLKILTTPRMYWSRYTLILGGLLLIVFVNAIFIFAPSLSFNYDISVLLYSAMSLLLYFNCVYYAGWTLRQTAPRPVLQNLNQPILLFDYEKNISLANTAARQLLKGNLDVDTMGELIDKLHMEGKIGKDTEKTSFQLVINKQFYRCDFQTLRKNKSLQGYVFSFLEETTEYDMLTGFHSAAAAQRDLNALTPEYPAGVLICDINCMARINENYGHEAGDRAIASVAKILKARCPEETYFLRLHDAMMAALCPGTSLAEMKEISARITEKAGEVQVEDEKLLLTCAFAMCTKAQPDLQKAFDSAEEALRVKKMLDPSSAHSSLLFSLARVLQESDPCTEAHVMRTRLMGEKLAARLGLSDEDAARLSLLCLLHDVGKLCIPLEVLNKPGKLSQPEWELLKSHTWKGWQIARASSELSPLADMILHHHERWDGKGYPGGLVKEETPLLSRMICIIDSFDAMTNDRPYQKKMSWHNAVLEMERNAGSQFDPNIAAVFCEMIRQEPAYLNEEAEEEKAEAAVPENESGGSLEQEEANGLIEQVCFSRYFLDAGGDQILAADENFERLTGYTPEDVSSGAVTQMSLIFPEDRKVYEKMRDAMLKKSGEAFLEHRLRMKNGDCRYVGCHGWTYYDTARKEQRNQIIITDMTESAAVRQMSFDSSEPE